MSIESERDLVGMRRAGSAVAETLRALQDALRPGITTAELDAIGDATLKTSGARPAPRLLLGFPAATCISVNDEAVHGIPGRRSIRSGDLVKLDVTAELDGYIADAAVTVAVAPAPAARQALADCASSALRKALGVARAGQPLSSIGRAIELEVRRHGFQVMPQLCGHGTGRAIWEEPTIPNYYKPRQRQLLTAGMILAIEPIICAGSGRCRELADGWTLSTADGSMAAHFEHTIMVTEGTPLVLTAA